MGRSTMLLLWLLVATAIPQTYGSITTTDVGTRNSTQECTLNCPNDAPCTIGEADISNHVVVELEASHNGMHCACPMGWTGVYCDKKFESCDNQAGHTCYHGGECIPGLNDKFNNEQLFCDCTNAVVTDETTDGGGGDGGGIRYVGKYCETPYENICNPGAPEDELLFCVNGGDCNPSFPETSAQPCICDDGWTGFHCEFKVGQVPDCTLQCQNNGVCLVGVLSTAEAEHMNHKWSLQEIEDHMRCACPPGFAGALCEESAEQCGDDGGGVCLHGGVCVTTTQTNNQGQVHTQYHCDCTAATDNDGNSYAGKYCEHKATDMCSETDWNLFCTQGGTCKANPIEGCTCPQGTAGYKCEFILENIENELQDDKDEDEDDDDEDDDEDDDDDDDFKPLNTRCGEGYCLNGASCVVEEVVTDNGIESTKETCECRHLESDQVFFAGEFCQYKSTTICDNGNFCVHQGICQEDGTCDCPTGWTGTHCATEALDDDDATGETCGEITCYNGGLCAETQIIGPDETMQVTLHCDCSSAFDDKHSYAGTSCQFPSTTLCTHPLQGENLANVLYCVNHGTCMSNPLLGCECPPGFYGFACEYESHDQDSDEDGILDLEDETDDKVDEDVQVCGPDGLVCHNGGRCETTVIENTQNGEAETKYECDCHTAHDDDTPYLGVSCEYPATEICDPPNERESPSLAPFCTNHGTCPEDSDAGCDCPIGFKGSSCQFKTTYEDIVVVPEGEEPVDYEDCGEDLVCLNGGLCTTTVLAGIGEQTAEIKHCDCSSAVDETKIFAGASCEYKATSLCASPADGSVGNIHFCANGGQCPTDSLMMPCKCDTAWQGFHCEFAVDAEDLPQFNDTKDDNGDESALECNLVCENDGVCAQGAKDLGSLHDTISDVSHLNQTFHSEHFTHCICPDGYIGLTCQHKLEICGKGDHVCLHGSTCVELDNEKYSCDCSKADEIVGPNTKPVFAGDSCQYTGTDICTIGDGSPGKPLFFCVNGGTCNGQVTPDQPDPGCTCPENYSGPHCEQRVVTFASSTSTSSGNSGGLIAGVTVAVVAVVLLAIVVGVRLTRKGGRGASPEQFISPHDGTPFPRRRRRKAGYGGSNLAPTYENRSDLAEMPSSSDPVASGFALPPDEEPGNDDVDGIMKVPLVEETSFVDVGPPQDEDENQLDNVDFV